MVKSMIILAFAMLAFVSLAFAKGEIPNGMDLSKGIPDIEKKVSDYVPIEIKADVSFLTPTQKKVLEKLIEASKLIDDLYFNQAWSKNPDFKMALSKDKNVSKAYLDYFEINYGPFDRTKENKPFIGGIEKPKGANFYPADMTKEEFERWVKDHPQDEKAFTSYFTVIKRDGKKLVAVPYFTEYAKWLKPASKLLKEAAALTENASLKKFLISRADAFLSNDYYQSDIDWMDIKNSPVEITIGPYEVYEDELFGYKASFESYVEVVNPKESQKLEIYEKYLKELDQNLPIADQYKNKREKYESPIRVVDVVYTAGDARKGIQTLAFNLPNDEKVIQVKGNKKVMLKNLMDAKFNYVFTKVADGMLEKDLLQYLSSETFLLETVHHELAHSLGPRSIKLSDGTVTTANKALKDKWSVLEEAKADVTGVYDLLYLIDKGVLPKTLEKSLMPTYLTNIFRTTRWGSESHGVSMTIQLNYLMGKGAIRYNQATGKFNINYDRVRPAFKDIVHDILMIEATGDYNKAVAMISNLGPQPNEVKTALAKLSGLPLDIKPIFAALK